MDARRRYYLVRMVIYSMLMLAGPIFLLRKGGKPDETSLTSVLILDALLAVFLGITYWRYRRLPAGTPVPVAARPGEVRAGAQPASRTRPVLMFLVGAAGILWVLHSWRAGGHGDSRVVLFAPVFLLVGLAGTIHPPLYHYMNGNEGRESPRVRALAYGIAILGVVIGFLAWLRLYH